MSVYAEDFFVKVAGGRKFVDMISKVKVTYHPLYPRNNTVRRLLPMIANTRIKKEDSRFKCEVSISEKYCAPVVEVEYDNYSVKRTFEVGSMSLEDLILKVDFYKRKMTLHENMEESEEAGDDWDPAVIEANKKEAEASKGKGGKK